jgi:hypothetical protein
MFKKRNVCQVNADGQLLRILPDLYDYEFQRVLVGSPLLMGEETLRQMEVARWSVFSFSINNWTLFHVLFLIFEFTILQNRKSRKTPESTNRNTSLHADR